MDKLICWDLDETLGRFYGVYARMNGHTYKGRDSIRPDIKETLEELSRSGFSHVVTTAAPKKEAIEALKSTDLLKFFLRIFHGDLIFRYTNICKDYSVVAKSFSMDDEEHRKRIIAIGDILPLDIHENGVFIWEPESQNYSAKVTMAHIRLISQMGNGNFWSGFRTLFEKGEQGIMIAEPALNDARRVYVVDGFETLLFYYNNSAVVGITMETGPK